MSDAKASEKGDRQDRAPDRITTPDAQEARVAGADDMASIEKQRTNASDGSLRRFSSEQIAAQEHSIELVYEGRTASRTEKKTERELLREMANKPENVNTQGLESIAKDQSLPEDKRALAGMIQEMRTQSKALGTPTDALDAYAREALQAELLAKSKTQLPQNVDQEDCGSFSYTDAKKGMTIGSRAYNADQLLAQGNLQNPVVTDATNARATDVTREKTLLYGHVSEPDTWDKVAALPEKTQAEIILTAIRANAEHWGREQAQRTIGSLMGTTEGVGQILQDMATITDFNHACLTGDKETAAKMGEAFGESFGRMLVGGVNILKISDDYLQDLGAQGDWTKPVKDLTRLNQVLNTAWDELPPMEQERLKSRFITEFAANALMPETSVRLLKAGKFTEVLPNMVKIAKRCGAELKELPGDINKTGHEFRDLFTAMFGKEPVLADGPALNAAMDQAKPGQDNVMMMVGKVKSHDFVKNLDGLDRICDLRLEHGVSNNRNIAYAEVHVPGKQSDLVAISGKHSPSGTVEQPHQRKFVTKPKGRMPTKDDSEVKILEYVANDLDKDATGTIHLYSEREPCASCERVIKSFRDQFKNISVYVEYGRNR